MFDDEKTNPATGETGAGGADIDVASIAARHPSTSQESGVRSQETGKRTKRIKLPDGSYISREDLAERLSSSTSANKQTGMGSGPAETSQLTPIAKEQVVAAIKSLIGVIDSRVQVMVRMTAEKITEDKKFAEDLREQVAMVPSESETMTQLTVIVLEKYNVLGTYAPEALLGICVLGYTYRVHSILRDLRKLKEEHGLSTQAAPTVDHRAERER